MVINRPKSIKAAPDKTIQGPIELVKVAKTLTLSKKHDFDKIELYILYHSYSIGSLYCFTLPCRPLRTPSCTILGRQYRSSCLKT